MKKLLLGRKKLLERRERLWDGKKSLPGLHLTYFKKKSHLINELMNWTDYSQRKKYKCPISDWNLCSTSLTCLAIKNANKNCFDHPFHPRQNGYQENKWCWGCWEKGIFTHSGGSTVGCSHYGNPHSRKQNYHMIQLCYSWAYIQKTVSQCIMETRQPRMELWDSGWN